MGDDPNSTTKLAGIVAQWVKFLLPIAIGAVGVYVGQIIAPLESRLIKQEKYSESFSAHVISDTEIMKEFSRRLSELEIDLDSHKERDHNIYTEKEDFVDFKTECRGTVKDLRRQIEIHNYNTNGVHSK